MSAEALQFIVAFRRDRRRGASGRSGLVKDRGNAQGRALVCLGLLVLLFEGCSLGTLERAVGVGTSTRGEILVRGEKVGELLLRPEACLSGDRGSFRGVDLLAPPFVLRVVAEPIEGLAVVLIDSESGERRGIFRRSACAVLRGDVQRTGWRVNDVADVSGFVEIECRLPSGEELLGSITFEHCH